MPDACGIPVGGIKVVVEYANRLVNDNYEVNIVCPASMFFWRSNFRKKMYYISKYLYFIISKRYSIRRWSFLDSRVTEHWVFSLNKRNVPESDIYIATGCETALYLNDYKVNPSQKFYLIQDFETWIPYLSESDIVQTYLFQMQNIVISHWLHKFLSDKGATSKLIPNGFDFNYFKCTNPVENRERYTVSLLYHKLEKKGLDEGFKALDIVKKRFPLLKVYMFGAYPVTQNLPNWYKFFYKPDREEHNMIYNNTTVFLGTSRFEGWGLTIGEAMICGCAVVCTDNDGYKEMAVDGENALVVPTESPDDMANAIMRLFEDDELRIKLANNGMKSIQRFSWDDSYEKFVGLFG